MRVRTVLFPGMVAALIVGASAADSQAGPMISFGPIGPAGSNPEGLQAQVVFEQVGTDLKVTLTNTKAGDEFFQANTLKGLFFDLDTNAALTLSSAIGSPLVYQQNSSSNDNADGSLDTLSSDVRAPDSTAPGGGGTVHGGWQFRQDLSGLPGLSQTRGFGTSGYGIFEGTNVQSAPTPNDFGITSAGDDVTTSQAQQMFNDAFVKNSIQFTLSGLPALYALGPNSVTNVRFQYGTSLSEANFGGGPPTFTPGTTITPLATAPEPATLALAVAGVLPLLVGAWRRRRRRTPTTA